MELNGHTYGWCSGCRAWWRIEKGVVRHHKVMSGEMAVTCSGGGAEPSDPRIVSVPAPAEPYWQKGTKAPITTQA